MMADSPLLPQQLSRVVQRAIERAQDAGQLPRVTFPDVVVERPPRLEMGDFATSFPLRAKRAVGSGGPNPLEIAGVINAQIADEPPAFLASSEIAAPGFINFILADDWVRGQLDAILTAGDSFGSVNLGLNRRVQVEFVSANPTGPLHVGGGRNAALGDSVARVLSRAGWRAHREYYYNDAGQQVAHLHHSVWVRYQQQIGRDVALPDTDYQGDYIVDLARDILAHHGDAFADLPEERASEIGALAVQIIMRWIEEDLERLHVHFDTWFSEASLLSGGVFDSVLDLLRERGLIYEREGATWLRSSQLGDERDRVLVRADGRPTYTATDIPYHYDKFFIRGFDRVIDVWGADHQGQVPSMKAIVRALGVEDDRFEIVLYQLVNVLRNGQPVRMGKRTGNVITVGEVLDEVGPDAMRWFLVSRSADAMMDFDVDLARKQSSDNPVYYVQYAHARLAKLLRDAPQDWRQGDVSLLRHPSELALIRRMLQLPEIVALAAQQLAPHHVPFYAYELARSTQAWYEAGNEAPSLRVLGEDDALTAARLKLAASARQVLANALDLIGVTAPDAM